MMKFETLLAKSYPKDAAEIPDYAKLSSHLRAVEDAGQAIVEAVGAKILAQLDLNGEIWFPRLRRGLRVACLAHDIGKANDHFQEMVDNKNKSSSFRQAARHELLSALLLFDENSEIRDWALHELRDDSESNENTEMLINCVIGAVAGHHLKMDEKGEKASQTFKLGDKGAGFGDIIQMFLTHNDLKFLLGDFVTQDVVFDLEKSESDSLRMRFVRFASASGEVERRLRKNPEWRRFAAALKALTAAADVAGSALVFEDNQVGLKNWIAANLDESRFVTAALMNEVVNVKLKLKGGTLRPFQKAVAGSKARVTLVEAGCGTGKTLAAYAWAANHADGRKLFFCYPTTGTATEGFKDYVAAPETAVEAELMHSRAAVDLQDIGIVEEDQEREDREKLVRIESLIMWSPQVVVCTADTVLALPRNNRKGIYGSPAILTASFVFDELHAYDDRMLAAVAALIKAMPNAHFLLMTASLPTARRDYLKSEFPELEEIPTPQDLEDLPRYCFNLTAQNKALNIAKNAVAENKKVLWICNTVARAQKVLDELLAADLPAHVYHSRFKYEHRKARHQETIDSFDPEKSTKAVIAMTTQVAEMSLDLDADVLISEVAPVSAMIQRLGRLNRRITVENPGTPRHANFYRAEKDLPYTLEEIEKGETWLDELIALSRPLTQSDLSEHFKKLAADEPLEINIKTRWLDSGLFAEAEEIRDGGNSVSIILPEDEKDCRKSVSALIRKTVPMNFHNRMKDWREYKGNLIAPDGAVEYDERRGAR